MILPALHRNHVIKLIFILFLVLSLWGSSEAQQHATDGTTPLGLSPGVPAGSYPLSDFDNVNLFNGSLNFSVPLVKVGGRGTAGYPITLRIDQKWLVDKEPSDGQPPVNYYYAQPGWWTDFGWAPVYSMGRMETRQGGSRNYVLVSGCGYVHQQTLTRLTFTAPDGTEYELRDQQTNGQPVAGSCTYFNRGTVFVSSDGSGAAFISDAAITDYPYDNPANIPPSGYMMLRDGTRYRIDGGNVSWIRDRNGNKVLLSYDTFQRVQTITDSLKRTVSISYNTTAGNYDQITLAGFGGATRTIKVHFASLSNTLRSDCSFLTVAQLFPELNGGGGYYDVLVVSSLELPNGQQYQFRYNSYSELARVTLPTGGAIEYDHSAGLSDSTTGSGVISGLAEKHIYRRLIERRVYPDGGSGSSYATRTTYSRPENTSTNAGYVIANQYDSSGTSLKHAWHYFNGSPRASFFMQPTEYPAWSDGREYKTEFYKANGALLRKVEHAFSQRAAVSWWSGGSATEPPNDPRLTQTVTTLADTNQVTKQTFGYDDTVPFNNQNNLKEYDFGNGAAGALLRETQTTFLTSASYTGYNVYLRSLPTQVSIYDGNGVEKARTTFEYDNYASDANHAGLTSRTGITGLDSSFDTNYTTRGNVTGITKYFLSGGTVTGSVVSYSQYDIAGNVVKTIDPRGNATNLFYDDCFGTPNGEARTNSAPVELGSLSTFAYVTKVTNALSQSSYVQFDYYLGQPVDGEDANGIIASGYFDDSLDRPTQLRRAVGTALANQTTFSYDDTGRTVTTTSDRDVNNDNLLVIKVLYDQMGRVTEKRQYEGGTNYVATETQYDILGRANKTSNPFRPWLSETPVWTTTVFDEFDRARSVTTPDNAVVTTEYVGNTVTSADPVLKKRKSVTDALGRLKEVYEDPDGLNYLTSYDYDVLDNLITVTQGTQPARSFTYNSFKQLTSVYNPESGTTNYQYDNNGNLLVKSDARGVSTHFSYDALNRVSRRWYNSSTLITSTTNNNPALPSGVGASNEATFYYDSQTLPSGAPSFSRGASVGKQVAVTYGASSTAGDYFGYDSVGRLVSKIQQTGAINYQVSAFYNLAGETVSAVYPSGHTISYVYDSAGRTSTFSGNLGDGATRTYASDITYSSAGSLSKEKFGTFTPVYNKLFYNVRGQLAEIRESTSYTGPNDTTWNRGAIINHYSNQCWGMCSGSSMTDNNGNLQKQEVYIPNDDQISGYTMRWQQYDYDSLNRLNWAREIKDGVEQWKQQFTYDRWGNRTINTALTYGTGITNKAFTVDTAHNQLGLPVGQPGTMTYDAAGNLTNDTYTGAGNRTYDGENKITSATGSSGQTEVYAYDASGQRIKRTVDGVQTWQVYGLGGELLAEYPANGAAASPQKEYGYRNGQLLVTADVAAAGAVSWTSAVGVTVSGNSLSKVDVDGWNAGAVSTQTINSGDGYVEVTASETNKHRRFGLSNGNTNQSWDDIDFCIYLEGSGTVYINEGATPRGSFGSYAAGDVFRVAVEGGVVTYRKNGALLYASTVSPTYPLLVDTALYSTGATLTNAVIYTGAATANLHWLITDQLGTPRMILDQSGSLANMRRHDYLPFGEELFTPTSNRTAAEGYASGDGLRQHFTAKERDNETALDYFRARYYASTQGRFLSADSFGGSRLNPQSLNRYAYVLNNPLNFIDPDGRAHTGVDDLLHRRHPDGCFGRLCLWKGQEPKKPDTSPVVDSSSINGNVKITELGIADEGEANKPQHRGWFRRTLSDVGFFFKLVGTVFINVGTPGYDEEFAASYQPKLTDFCPPNRQCGIFFPVGGVGPGSFAEEDLALGIHENLASFRGAARIGTDLPVTEDLWSALTTGIDETVAAGGKIRFNLDGVDVYGAFSDTSPVYNTYTSRELRYIFSKPEIHQNTVFYLNGVEQVPQ